MNRNCTSRDVLRTCSDMSDVCQDMLKVRSNHQCVPLIHNASTMLAANCLETVWDTSGGLKEV